MDSCACAHTYSEQVPLQSAHRSSNVAVQAFLHICSKCAVCECVGVGVGVCVCACTYVRTYMVMSCCHTLKMPIQLQVERVNNGIVYSCTHMPV